MKHNTYKSIAGLITCVALVSCSSSESDTVPEAFTGVFIDSAVQGLEYETATQNGTTNAAGEFRYMSGETLIFSIGTMVLPSATGAEVLTPIELAAGSIDSEVTATNIARLLQSLDNDGDPSNGIVIADGASAIAVPVNFDVSISEFENNPDVINLVANSGSSTTVLIGAEAAAAHLLTSIAPPTVDSLGPAGFWVSENDYFMVTGTTTNNYTVTFFDLQNLGTIEECFTTRDGELELLMDNLYLLTSEGESLQIIISRTATSLGIVPLGTFDLEAAIAPSSLTLCV